MRVPITRHDQDGTVIDGTAEATRDEQGLIRWADFRDLDGRPLMLPPFSTFEINTMDVQGLL